MVSSNASRVLFLLLMPVVIAEFLTGSTPLPSLIDPLTLPTLLGLYGAGALLVREATVAWRKGWPTVLALGCAYGVVEEALDVKSWFNPHWAGLGALGTYGRLFGVNWVWSVELTIFHSVFSITIPIVLATLVFPDSTGKRWLNGRSLPLVGGLFVADVVFGFAFFPYSPPPVPYLAALSLALALILIARAVPSTVSRADQFPAWDERVLLLAGFLTTALFFFLFWAVPTLQVPPAIVVAAAVALCATLAWSLTRNRLSKIQAYSLVSGALGFLIVISVISLRLISGTPFVGLALAVYLCSLHRRVTSDYEPLSRGP